ncbi:MULTISPECIES: type VII secretion system-associated protein [Amycolatopsis]|uniref:Type VII secretion system-associated protein n=1 Tax=Amycolatopsis albidoflavus TaxID=102226 RepID=A0ABW5HRI6_9PSEU
MSTVTETPEGAPDDQLENWFLLMDPAWRPQSENEPPPIEAVVGLWPVEEGGKLGKFRANPQYEPSDENSPSDPLDAVLRLVMKGDATAEHIQLILRETLFDIAMNGDGRPLITQSPDDKLCTVIVTSEVHRLRINAPDWARVDLDELVELLEDEIDVFINPGGPSAVRLDGDFIRETLMMDEEELAGLYAEHQLDSEGLRVVPVDLTRPPGEDTSEETEAEEAEADGAEQEEDGTEAAPPPVEAGDPGRPGESGTTEPPL